jgi:hypothetical protein
MSPIIYIQYAIMAIAALAMLWAIASYLDMFFKMAGSAFGLWMLTAAVGTFKDASFGWDEMKTFAIVYGFGMLIVFCVSVFIISKMDNEKSYQEPYDDEIPTTVYIGEPIVVDGVVVEDMPTPLRGLWRLPAPKRKEWQNPYAKVGNMGYGGTIGGEWEFAHCKKCNKVTGQKQVSKHTFVCREPGCANVNHFEH